MPAVIATLNTPYRDAHAALDALCAIRKAEGLAPNTISLYRNILQPFLREHPDFLQNPRAAILPFISEPEKAWSRFTRIKVLKVFCSFLVEEGVLEDSPMKNCGVPREIDSQNTRISSRFVTMLRIPSVSYPAFPKHQYSSGVRYPFEA